MVILLALLGMSPFEMSEKGLKMPTRRHVTDCWQHVGQHVADMVKMMSARKVVAGTLPTYFDMSATYCLHIGAPSTAT